MKTIPSKSLKNKSNSINNNNDHNNNNNNNNNNKSVDQQYTIESLKNIDDNGALQAKTNIHILETMIHESFYNVHITAQEQVPKPIDIDITEIININAYQSIIKFDIYDNNKDSSNNDPISFLPHHIRKVLSSPSSLDYNNNNSSNINSSIYHDVVVNDDDDVDDDKNNQKSSSVWDLSTLNSGVTTKNSDDIFILTKGNNKLSTDVQPLAKLLGDSYEDRYNNDKMKEKKNKIKKDKNHQNKYNNNNNIHVNIIEMIPAGAMESNNNHNSSTTNGNSKIKGNSNSSPHNKKKSSLVKSSSLSSSTKNNQISGEVS